MEPRYFQLAKNVTPKSVIPFGNVHYGVQDCSRKTFITQFKEIIM